MRFSFIFTTEIISMKKSSEVCELSIEQVYRSCKDKSRGTREPPPPSPTAGVFMSKMSWPFKMTVGDVFLSGTAFMYMLSPWWLCHCYDCNNPIMVKWHPYIWHHGAVRPHVHMNHPDEPDRGGKGLKQASTWRVDFPELTLDTCRLRVTWCHVCLTWGMAVMHFDVCHSLSRIIGTRF